MNFGMDFEWFYLNDEPENVCEFFKLIFFYIYFTKCYDRNIVILKFLRNGHWIFTIWKSVGYQANQFTTMFPSFRQDILKTYNYLIIASIFEFSILHTLASFKAPYVYVPPPTKLIFGIS